jgi:hypothetical protein
MENTKEQVVAEWKAVNEPRLKEIKSANPDLYSAINLALNYLNKKLGGDELPVEVDELPFKIGDVFRRNIEGEQAPNTEITYTITEIQNDKIGVYVQFFAGNTNKPKNVFKKIEDVLEEIETAGWVLYEGQTSETKQWTLDDFKYTKIIVDTPEKSIRLQGLLLELGAEWLRTDVRNEYSKKLVNNTNEKYLVINEEGTIYLLPKGDWSRSPKPERIYEEIFPDETVKTTWRFKTREELDAEGISVTLGIPESDFNTYLGKPLSEIYSKERFNNLDEAVKSLENNNIYLGKAQWSSHIDYFTQNPLPTQSTANPETYPAQTELTFYYTFTPNKGERKSPTQSAGELKKIAEKHSTSAVQIELLSTKFKGNDGNWYSINIGKTGTWTWKETTPPPLQTLGTPVTQESSMSQNLPSNASSQPASTTTTQKEWKVFDLVGKKLNWNGKEYDVVSFKKNNPKFKVFTLRREDGKEMEGKLTMGLINRVLNDEFVSGLSIIKPAQTTATPENDFQLQLTKMTVAELNQLSKDTSEARNEFIPADEEYTELTDQLVDIEKEINKRK